MYKTIEKFRIGSGYNLVFGEWRLYVRKEHALGYMHW